MLNVIQQSVHCHIKNSQSVVIHSSSIIFSLEMGMVKESVYGASIHTSETIIIKVDIQSFWEL